MDGTWSECIGFSRHSNGTFWRESDVDGFLVDELDDDEELWVMEGFIVRAGIQKKTTMAILIQLG
jgi:hypothetical protein